MADKTNNFETLVSRLLNPETPLADIRRLVGQFAKLDLPEALHALRLLRDSSRVAEIDELEFAIEECYFHNLVRNEKEQLQH